ncbi:MAG: lipid A export permease/ATP-binding protein MsbA [Candidatus Electronema sp. V4]|uniref:lipid A export permease/ATP-binding protein MsbA n=1 Tax=Candidatus Electronema sp. V4 TaxID=3454756 RepID=UPI0040557DE9
MTNRAILLRLRDVLRPYSGKLLIAMTAMIVVALFNAAQAYMVQPLLDKIFYEKNAAWLTALPLALLAIFFVKGVFYFFYSYLLEWVGQSVIKDLRNSLYGHLHELSMGFFYKNSTGELISRIMNDVAMLQGTVSHALIYVLRDFFSVAGLLAVIFYMDWRLALVSLIFIPMAAVPIVVFGKKFRRISTRYQQGMGEASNFLNETIRGIRIVKAFCAEEQEKRRFAAKMQQLFDTLMSETRYRSLAHPLIEFLGGIGMALIIWFGGSEVLKGNATPGTFMSFLTALVMLYEPIKGVSKINSTVQSGMAGAARIFALLDTEPEIREKENAVELPPFSRQIEFRNVSFAYQPGEPVLREVSLTIARGEVVALVGPSGGGKSSLASLLPRFHEVTDGAVLLDGHDLRDLSLRSLRSQIAIVTQQTILFNDTVRSNIAYGSHDCSEEEIRRAAAAAFALDFIEAFPQGFDTVIGESGVRLSGGQQQRLSIARAILKNAPILILDEATSALDTESERKVQQALDNLMKNRTTLVIAHRLSTIKNADRIVVMQDGRIAEEGDHDSLLRRGGIYEGLHSLQHTAR